MILTQFAWVAQHPQVFHPGVVVLMIQTTCAHVFLMKSLLKNDLDHKLT